MGLGIKLLRSMTGSRRRKRRHRSELMEAVGLVAAGALAYKYVKAHPDVIPQGVRDTFSPSSESPAERSRREAMERLNLKKEAEEKKQEPPKEQEVRRSEPEEIVDPEEARKFAMSRLGGIALCWYIAGADGTLSESELEELTTITNSYNDDPRINKKYKGGITKDIANPNITFDAVTKYLDYADSAYLISLAIRAEWIAQQDGVTPMERDAVDSFKFYVEKRTGHHFDHIYQEAKEIDLNCPTCGAIMELDDHMLKATCTHCGFTRIIDANQIAKVLAEEERTKRLQGLYEDEEDN